MPYEPFHGELRAHRLARGLTMRQVAGAVHVSEATVSRWETGARRPHASDLKRIAAALDVSADKVRVWTAGSPPHRGEALPGVPGLGRVRRASHRTRAELAKEMGVSAQTVAHWERGRRRLPTHRLRTLSIVLDVPLHDLLVELGIPDRPDTLGALARARRRAGLSQKSAASILGVSGSLLAQWEQGRRQPRWPHVRSLAATYGLTLGDAAAAVGLAAPALLDQDRWSTSEFGAISREIRIWRGESLVEVAARAGVHWQTLCRWERGHTRPSAQRRARLATALGINVALPT